MSNELNFTLEMLEKAKTAPSTAALLALAQENGITLTAEQAAEYFVQLHPEAGALSDAELDEVAGGWEGADKYAYCCPRCGSTNFILLPPDSSMHRYYCINCKNSFVKTIYQKVYD